MTAFGPVWAHRDLLAQGFAITLGVSLAAIAIGLVLAVLLAALRLSPFAVPRRLAAGLVDVLRGLPFLILMLLVHFALPLVLFRVPAIVSGTAALALYASAYFAEALRAAYLAVPRGQLEAAKVLGLRTIPAIRTVVAPQMMAVFAPAGRVVAVMLLKESAVLSVITVPELTHASLRIQAESFATVPVFVTVALLYWSMTLAIAGIAARLERRFGPVAPAAPRHGPVAARYLTLDWPQPAERPRPFHRDRQAHEGETHEHDIQGPRRPFPRRYAARPR